MRRRPIGLAILSLKLLWLAGCTQSSAPTTASPTDGRSDAGPSICRLELLDSPEGHTDRAPLNARLVRRVRMRNLESTPIELRVLAATCGCLDVSISPSVVAPGDVAEVSIAVMTHTLEVGGGHLTLGARPLASATPSGTQPESEGPWRLITLGQTFRTLIDFLFLPDGGIDIVAVEGGAFERAIYLRRARHGVATAVRSGDAGVPGATVLPDAPDADALIQRILIRGVAGPPGAVSGHVRLDLADAPVDTWHIPIRLRSLPRFRAAPSAITVGPDDASGSLKRIALRGAVLSAPVVRIPESLRSAIGVHSMTCGAPDGTEWVLVVSLDPDRLPGSAGRDVIDILSEDGQVLLSVPVLWIRGN